MSARKVPLLCGTESLDVSDTKNRVEANVTATARKESLVHNGGQFNFVSPWEGNRSARKVPLLRHTTADQFSFRLSTAGKAYPRRHTTAVQKHSIFRRKESRRSRTWLPPREKNLSYITVGQFNFQCVPLEKSISQAVHRHSMFRHKESCRSRKWPPSARKVSPAEEPQQSLKQHGASKTRVEQWNFRWSKRLTAVTRRTLSGLQATTVSGQQSLRNTAPAENAGHCVIPNSQPREEYLQTPRGK